MNRQRDYRLGGVVLAGYIATIFLANVFISHVGWCAPQAPCTIPVGFGLWAPSGVLWVGLALWLRDLTQDTLGRRWAIAGILVGAALSYLVAAPALAFASGAAFLLSEAADFAVYSPLRASGRHVAAVFASGVVGSIVDSVVFLLLAFNSLTFLSGQVLGTWEVSAAAALTVWCWQRSKRRVRTSPGALASPTAGGSVRAGQLAP